MRRANSTFASDPPSGRDAWRWPSWRSCLRWSSPSSCSGSGEEPGRGTTLRERLGDHLFRYRGEWSLLVGAAALGFARPTPASLTIGLACAAAGETLRLLALRRIGRVSRTSKEASASRLVRTGPYAWTRNPLYLANLMLVLGGLIALGCWEWLATLGPLIAWAYTLIIRIEERALLAAFGDDYRDYCQRVPRLWPRRPRRAADAPVADSPRPLREVLSHEISTIVALELAISAVAAMALLRT